MPANCSCQVPEGILSVLSEAGSITGQKCPSWFPKPDWSSDLRSQSLVS